MTSHHSNNLDLRNIHRAHFVGIGGIGVSAILRLFADRGISVSGSDIQLPGKEKLPEGVYYSGHNKENVSSDVDVLIYSPAVPESNLERVSAHELGIPQLSYPEALALVTKQYSTIAISGTHGKSTTTALTGILFETGGLDPSVIVGAEVPEWKEHNLRRGSSDIFIVEACEYRRNMLNLSPQAIVLTNIELDHPDYYSDLNDVKSAFREYIDKLSGDNLLVVNNDDANIRDVVKEFDGILLHFGIGTEADLVAKNISQQNDFQTFELVWHGSILGTFKTTLPGTYNIYNILASTCVYLAYGGKTEVIQQALDQFQGIGRRFESIGKLQNATVISDYAHHPTALHAVVSATKEKYPDQRLLVVFRPHHRERTIKLFSQFIDVISKIPHIILVEIYDVAGREEGISISSKNIIEEVIKIHLSSDIIYAKDLDEAEMITRKEASHYDIILVIGAGDTDQLAHRLVLQESDKN